MLKRTFYINTFLIIFLLLLSFSLWADSAFSRFDVHKDMVDMSQEKVIIQTDGYSVPRNQVLLEVATGTW